MGSKYKKSNILRLAKFTTKMHFLVRKAGNWIGLYYESWSNFCGNFLVESNKFKLCVDFRSVFVNCDQFSSIVAAENECHAH